MGIVPTIIREGQTYSDINLGWMVSVASPIGYVWLPIPKSNGQVLASYGQTWLTIIDQSGFLKWVMIKPQVQLRQSLGAAAAASVKDESMGSLASSLGSMSLAPAAKPSIKYTVVQSDSSSIQPGGRIIPIPVRPMPPPKPFNVYIMRGFDTESILRVPESEIGDNSFTFELPLIMKYPEIPQDLLFIIGSFGGGGFSAEPHTIKFNSLTYMKNYIGSMFKTNVIPGISLNDIWLMWGEDPPPPVLSILVNHMNSSHSFTKEEVARLTHILHFIPYYYQLRKYENKLHQRIVEIISTILQDKSIPQFNLNTPYPPALISGLNKINLVGSRILFNETIEGDFNNGAVYNIVYKDGASTFTFEEAPLIEKLIKNICSLYLSNGYIALGDAIPDKSLAGGRRRRAKTCRKKTRRSNTRNSLRK